MKKLNILICSTLFLVCFCLTALCAGNSLAASGTLTLVSMGTGDPENMTLRAHKAIEAGDLFFSMGGKSPHPELTRGKPVYNAEHGLFGDGGARPRISSEEAEELRAENRSIIRQAVGAGKNVVILENGDPAIFGPQIGYMQEFSDLDPHIVPGLSSFNAANAALMSSVVSGKAGAVMLTSGRLNGGRGEFLARAINDGVTMALFMVRDLDAFVGTLRNHKVPDSMPVAIVANAGSLEKEKVVRATLGTLKEKFSKGKIGPYLLYIGDSVKG